VSEYYLLKHGTASSQFRSPRREKWSGVIVVHTDEAPQQPGGSLGTAAFISRRSDPGSYHTIVDSTTTTRLVPPAEYEVWGAAYPTNTNSHALHLAFRGRRSEWGKDPAYDNAALNRAADEIALWMKMLHGDAAPQFVRWISVQDCIARRPGLVEHGTIQPGDRVDPWVRLPQQQEFRDRLSSMIRARLGNIPSPPGVDVNQNKPVMLREPNGTIFMYYGGTPWRTHVKSPDDAAAFRFMGVDIRPVDATQAAFFRRNSQLVKTG
jgi:hypothetical protein